MWFSDLQRMHGRKLVGHDLQWRKLAMPGLRSFETFLMNICKMEIPMRCKPLFNLPKWNITTLHIFVPVVLLLFLLAACAEVPLTQRRALHLVPESDVVALSLKEYEKVLKKSKLSTDQEKVKMVREVGMRIAMAAEGFLKDHGMRNQLKNYHWEFNLIDNDEMVNAWCMPGGKVAVYTGILKYTRDENGLAVVLGHEIAHAIARHGSERMSQVLLANMGGMALAIALSEKPSETRNLFLLAYGVGANLGFVLPYSRIQESEADRIGLMLMAKAGYDPRTALDFWERMRAENKNRMPEFLSTHPAPSTRIARLKEYINEALPYYEMSKKK